MDSYTEIKQLFEANADAKRAAAMANYMRNQFVFYGILTPKRRSLCHHFIKKAKKCRQVNWAFLDECYQDEHREFQYLVYDILIAVKSNLNYEDIPHIRSFILQKSWWDTVDFLVRVIDDIGLRDVRVNACMLEWSKDSNIWIRRAAIEHQLSRKEKTDTELLKQILVHNFNSDEFFINKAVGWSLRAYSKTNPQWVKDFIDTYRDQMHPLSIKEASKYIS